MQVNEGMLDRGIRLVVGLGLIGATLAGQIGVWGWIGVVPVITALVGYCPAYSILGIRTCKAPTSS